MIQSVKKAMEIVDLVAVEGSISITELAARMAMHKSTVCRLAQTLEASGYLEQNPLNGKYELSYRFFRVGYAILEKSGIRNCVLPVLKHLGELTNETVNFTMLDGTHVLYLEKVESSPLYGGIKVGARAPLHCTATGKVMLSNLDPHSLQELLVKIQPLKAYTETTLVTAEALLNDLEKCRVRGYGIVRDELGNGASSVAAFVRNYPGGKATAVGIAGPQSRFTNEKFEELGKLVIAAAEEISNRFML